MSARHGCSRRVVEPQGEMEGSDSGHVYGGTRCRYVRPQVAFRGWNALSGHIYEGNGRGGRLSLGIVRDRARAARLTLTVACLVGREGTPVGQMRSPCRSSDVPLAFNMK